MVKDLIYKNDGIKTFPEAEVSSVRESIAFSQWITHSAKKFNEFYADYIFQRAKIILRPQNCSLQFQPGWNPTTRCQIPPSYPSLCPTSTEYQDINQGSKLAQKNMPLTNGPKTKATSSLISSENAGKSLRLLLTEV